MSRFATSLEAFFSDNAHVMQIRLEATRGSSPREAGTLMYVSLDETLGTIGGGQLELMIIEHARQMLKNGVSADRASVSLGPDIGQCCGGSVDVSLAYMSAQEQQTALDNMRAAEDRYPHVYLFGAGHVGRALARQLQHLPVHCVLVDSREEELSKCTAEVEKRLSIVPEFEIRSAPNNSAFVVLTHDHALDFLLTAEALKRCDARYVGMIGSKTKRAKFSNWCRTMDIDIAKKSLNCPIGANESGDKRPSVIAAFVVAEIMTELMADTAASELDIGSQRSVSPHDVSSVDSDPITSTRANR